MPASKAVGFADSAIDTLPCAHSPLTILLAFQVSVTLFGHSKFSQVEPLSRAFNKTQFLSEVPRAFCCESPFIIHVTLFDWSGIRRATYLNFLLKALLKVSLLPRLSCTLAKFAQKFDKEPFFFWNEIAVRAQGRKYSERALSEEEQTIVRF